jgi:ribosomal protein S18 acetylase RimI-like enzyme
MWEVEPAAREDAEKIAELYERVWKGYEVALPEPLFRDRIPSTEQISKWMESMTYFIVRSEDEIAGVVRCSIIHGTCLLDRMVVDGDFRRQGMGTALTQRVIAFAREKGATKVWLDSSPRLTAAISLYKKMGFRECGHFQKHYWGEDIKFFELLLE